MSRATNAPASRRRRKRRLDQAKGFYGSRSKLFRMATESVDRAMVMATEHRRKKKPEYRALWIMRLSAACRQHEMSYSRFIDGMAKSGILLNRKMLSEIAINDPEGFAQLIERAKAQQAA